MLDENRLEKPFSCIIPLAFATVSEVQCFLLERSQILASLVDLWPVKVMKAKF